LRNERYWKEKLRIDSKFEAAVYSDKIINKVEWPYLHKFCFIKLYFDNVDNKMKGRDVYFFLSLSLSLSLSASIFYLSVYLLYDLLRIVIDQLMNQLLTFYI